MIIQYPVMSVYIFSRENFIFKTICLTTCDTCIYKQNEYTVKTLQIKILKLMKY